MAAAAAERSISYLDNCREGYFFESKIDNQYYETLAPCLKRYN
jgi:hypothetical protein